ncbi:MAG: phosphate uptake regulator PhoU [Thermoplasmata archaeon]|jgi:phosphate uptake regulator
MEGRKLPLAGGSTYLVSLPKGWVRNAGLKARDMLLVETATDGAVSVRPHATEKPAARRKVFREKRAEAREHLLRKFIGAHISGFGVIEVRFPPDRGPFARRVAREFCPLVIGPEVIEESRNSLVIQDLSDPSELSSEKCLRRMHLTVRTMVEDAVLALKRSGGALANDVALRDQDIDRLYWMVAKQYHRAGTAPSFSGNGFNPPTVQSYQLVAKLLERIGDHAQRIASTYPHVAEGSAIDPRLAKDLEEAAASAVVILDHAFHSLIVGTWTRPTKRSMRSAA